MIDWLNEISYADLTEEQQALVDIIGLERFISLVRSFGGSNIYIPNCERVSCYARNKQIQKEFDGSNYNKLGQKYGLTSVSIRNIIKMKDA